MQDHDAGRGFERGDALPPHVLRRRSLGVFLIIMALAAALLLPLTVTAYRTQLRAVHALLELNQRNHAGLHAREYARILGMAASDLLYLSSRGVFLQVLREGAVAADHPLRGDLRMFSECKGSYAFISLYDHEGIPLIRIGHERGRAFVQDSADPRDDMKPEFVAQALEGDAESMHLSPLTLRMRGDAVASPPRPALSMARVLFDEASGLRGLLVIELHAEAMLLEVERMHLHVTGMPLLVNGSGYYLMGETASDEWGYLFAERADATLAKRDPEAWHQMQRGEQGQFHTARGLYSFARIFPAEHMIRMAGREPRQVPSDPDVVNPHGVWYAISYVPVADLEAKTADVRLVFTWSGILLSLAAVLLAWFGARFYGLRLTARHALQEANAQLSRTVQNLRRSYEEISTLNAMEDFIQSCDTVEELFTVVERYGQLLFPRDAGGFYVRLPRERMLEQVVRWGEAMETEPLVPEDACWAFRRDQPHRVPADDASLRCPHQAHTGPGGSLCLPMGAKGALIGMMHLKLGAVPGAPVQDGASRSLDDTLRLASSIAEHVALTLTNMQLRDELRAQSIRDPLTELFNRRYMEETFEREWRRAQRQRQPMGLILFDVDHFKQVNDTRGHEAGDLVLAGLGRLLRDLVRQEDVPCRYGGEEFMVIMPGSGLAAAEERAEHLRAAVEKLSLTYQGEPLHITISLGVVAFPVHGHSPDTLIHAADAALYAAKHAGRNCMRTPPPGRPVMARNQEEP